jgi:hypothetical protein
MKKTSKVYITKRDIEILSFINQFGFCEILQIQKQFNLKKSRSYQVIKRLTEGGLLYHQHIFYGQHGVYYLTEDGACHTALPALQKLSYRHYHHHLKVIEVAMRLKAHYPKATWISERQLLIEKFKSGRRKKEHLADGLLLLAEDEKIAIEVELSRKGQERLKYILKKYAGEDYKEVWYYCPPGITTFLKTLTQRMPFIKIFNIEEFLA